MDEDKQDIIDLIGDYILKYGREEAISMITSIFVGMVEGIEEDKIRSVCIKFLHGKKDITINR